MIDKYGFIFLAPASDPARHRFVLETGGMVTLLVAVPDPSMAPAIAASMVAGGVQLIELCGAFGPQWTSKVLEATAHAVPVGAVAYGAESVRGLTALIADAPA